MNLIHTASLLLTLTIREAGGPGGLNLGPGGSDGGDLEGVDQLRSGQHSGGASHGGAGGPHLVPAAACRGHVAGEVRADLSDRWRAGAVERDRERVRVREGQV